jgi:hypothetical protein
MEFIDACDKDLASNIPRSRRTKQQQPIGSSPQTSKQLRIEHRHDDHFTLTTKRKELALASIEINRDKSTIRTYHCILGIRQSSNIIKRHLLPIIDNIILNSFNQLLIQST